MPEDFRKRLRGNIAKYFMLLLNVGRVMLVKNMKLLKSKTELLITYTHRGMVDVFTHDVHELKIKSNNGMNAR